MMELKLFGIFEIKSRTRQTLTGERIHHCLHQLAWTPRWWHCSCSPLPFFHLMTVDQVGVDLTIGLGDGCPHRRRIKRSVSSGHEYFHSSPVRAVFLILFTAVAHLLYIFSSFKFKWKQERSFILLLSLIFLPSSILRLDKLIQCSCPASIRISPGSTKIPSDMFGAKDLAWRLKASGHAAVARIVPPATTTKLCTISPVLILISISEQKWEVITRPRCSWGPVYGSQPL